MLLIILSVLFVHLFIGSFITRHDYAIQVAKVPVLTSKEQERFNYLERKFSNQRSHQSFCNMRYHALESRGCDCNAINDWMEYKSFKGTDPALNLGMIPFWPAYGYAQWLKSGTVKIERQTSLEERLNALEETNRELEADCGIKPIGGRF